MVGSKEGSCSSSKLELELGDSDTEEQMIEEQPDEVDTSLADDSMMMSDDVLDSSFVSVGNDDLELQGNANISGKSPVSCKMCRKRRKKARMYQRKIRKLERELKSREKLIETLESEKKSSENIEKVWSHLPNYRCQCKAVVHQVVRSHLDCHFATN